ncbi:aldolase [Aspergillus sclerotioniger CBS 115572]|uniref:Aldolase n=1 Tax=Aspergillus sclerotioniger CBS 115572 TaxID=1450535 RepID=A0A317VEC3_9EURO|nr:aldolase [Aspergillus sclerotioniger CBS 115572]PWY71789.1 aldolase [Aspergillus sclerotioniger CBS 115572]
MTSTISAKRTTLPPGVFCPVISLFRGSRHQEVDFDASYKFFTYLIRSGVDGLVLAGTTAEAVLLSPSERQELLGTARRAACDLGFDEYPLVAGISGQSVNETLRLAEEAREAGADFGLLLPPSYWPKAVTKDVLIDFYTEIADSFILPIVIYSFPAICNGMDMSSDVMATLAQHPNIVGVKLTCGNAGKVTRLTHEYSHEQFGVYAGSSDWLIPCLSGGGSGCVTGVANVFPKSTVKLFALWKAGQVQEAMKLQGLISLAERACKEGIAPTKFATAYFAGPEAGVTDPEAFRPRKPYKPSSQEIQDWVVEVMQPLVETERSLPDVVGQNSM